MADDISVMVVLPAGGSGERFGSEIPKQFLEVCGKPVIYYAIKAMSSVLWIEKIVVPIPQKYADLAMKIKHKYNFTKVEFISGMETRHRSIHAGVKQLSPNIKPDDIVIIHDAVRPFLTQDFLTQIVDAAKNHGASGAVRSLVSTIVKSTTDDFLDVSLDRREYRESHTPQAFKYKFIKEAYQKCTEDDFLYGTECLLLVQKYSNISAKLVDGPEYLWKSIFLDVIFNYLQHTSYLSYGNYPATLYDIGSNIREAVTHQKDVMLMEHYIKEKQGEV